jgi:UPF0042 nucleotide-binding protein
MQFLIITGMSGGGKSKVADTLEDLDFYCVDNLPIDLVLTFANLCLQSKDRYNKVALVIDIRERENFGRLPDVLEQLSALGCRYRILFVDADTSTLVRRYKESRRPHPLEESGKSLEKAIAQEKKLLLPLRSQADYVINTTNMTLGRLRQRILRLFEEQDLQEENLAISIYSFGYKFGLPLDADIVFDVRFLPNPFYVEELRSKNGLDKKVQEYVFSSDLSKEFMDRFVSLLAFLIPLYETEGKTLLNIAVGCTGGQHRSVAVATVLTKRLKEQGYNVQEFHRDI